MLVPLAYHVASRCHVVETTSTPVLDAPPAVDVVEAPAIPGFADRIVQPVGSLISVEEQPGLLTFGIPPLGIMRGTGGLFLFALLWCGFMAIFTTLVVRDFGNHDSLEILLFITLIAFFWAIGIGIMLAAIQMGRRHAGIVVNEDGLSIVLSSLLGTKEKNWTRSDVQMVRVGPSNINVNDAPVPELQIVDQRSKHFGLLVGYDVAELEWLATRLRQALAIASPGPASDAGIKTDDVETPPRGCRVRQQTFDNGFTLSVPREWISRNTIGLWIFAVVWNGALAAILAIVFHINEKTGDVGAGFIILGMLVAGGFGFFAMVLHLSIRRVEIAVADGRLFILQSGLTGKRRHEWKTDELAGVRSTNNQQWCELQIIPRSGDPLRLSGGRNPHELAWIATCMRRALDVPAGPVSK